MKRCFEKWSMVKRQMVQFNSNSGQVDAILQQTDFIAPIDVPLDSDSESSVAATQFAATALLRCSFSSWTQKFLVQTDLRLLADHYCVFRTMKKAYHLWRLCNLAARHERARLAVKLQNWRLQAKKLAGLRVIYHDFARNTNLETLQKTFLTWLLHYKRYRLSKKLFDTFLYRSIFARWYRAAMRQNAEHVIANPINPSWELPVRPPEPLETLQPLSFANQTPSVSNDGPHDAEMETVAALYDSFIAQRNYFLVWKRFFDEMHNANKSFLSALALTHYRTWTSKYHFQMEIQNVAEDLYLFTLQKKAFRHFIGKLQKFQVRKELSVAFYNHKLNHYALSIWIERLKLIWIFQTHAVQFSKGRKLSKSYNYWASRFQQIVQSRAKHEREAIALEEMENQEAVAQMYDLFLKLKRSFKIWMRRCIRYRKFHSLALKWFQQSLIKEFYGNWSGECACRYERAAFADHCYRRHILMKAWNHWISSQIMLEKAERFRQRTMILSSFYSWFRSQALSVANRFHRFHVTNNAFKGWNRALKFQFNWGKESSAYMRKSLLIRFFQGWYKTCAQIMKNELEAIEWHQLAILGRSIVIWKKLTFEQSNVDIPRTKTLFRRWYSLGQQQAHALKHYRKNLLVGSMNIWRGRMNMKKQLTSKLKALQSGVKEYFRMKRIALFVQWQMRYKEQVFRTKKNFRDVVSIWISWKRKVKFIRWFRNRHIARTLRYRLRFWVLSGAKKKKKMGDAILYDSRRVRSACVTQWRLHDWDHQLRISRIKTHWFQWKTLCLRFIAQRESMTQFLGRKNRILVKRAFTRLTAVVQSKHITRRYLKRYFLRWKSATMGTQDVTALKRAYWARWRSRYQRKAFDTARKIVFAEAWFEKQLQRKVLLGWSKASGKHYISRYRLIM
jgi:hypothetical protein